MHCLIFLKKKTSWLDYMQNAICLVLKRAIINRCVQLFICLQFEITYKPANNVNNGIHNIINVAEGELVRKSLIRTGAGAAHKKKHRNQWFCRCCCTLSNQCQINFSVIMIIMRLIITEKSCLWLSSQKGNHFFWYHHDLHSLCGCVQKIQNALQFLFQKNGQCTRDTPSVSTEHKGVILWYMEYDGIPNAPLMMSVFD